MTPHLAAALTELFAHAGTRYPNLLPAARVAAHNASGSKITVEARTPADAAEALRILGNGGHGSPLFARGEELRASAPLQLAMDMNMAPGAGGQCVRLRALVLTFRAADRAGMVWLHGHDGPQRGPKLAEAIDAFARAGQDWRRVNFVFRENGTHLRLLR